MARGISFLLKEPMNRLIMSFLPILAASVACLTVVPAAVEDVEQTLRWTQLVVTHEEARFQSGS